MYDNYTLFELINIVNKQNIRIYYPFNKKEILKIIKEKNIDIPEKKGNIKNTEWCIQDIYSEDFRKWFGGKKENVIWCKNEQIMICSNNLIKNHEEDKEHIILNICDDDVSPYVVLKDTKKEHIIQKKIDEFMKILDYDDITIESDWISYRIR